MNEQVASALVSVGSHRAVKVDVTGVSVDGDAVVIDLVLGYATATPVCCDQPGCYLPFLGLAREQVPAAIGAVLGIPAPAVTVRAELKHEAGYRHIDHATGRMTEAGLDHVQVYDPGHFARS